MPDSPPSTSPAPRIAETAAGKILAGLLALFYIFLAPFFAVISYPFYAGVDQM